MDVVPAPLTPPDADMTGFAYMPLDVQRLRDSDLAAVASDGGFRAAVLGWCVAWQQVPAGSLPDDDVLLARLLGFGRDVASFKAVRVDALRGYVKCSDGRLYHPVVCEKEVEALAKRRSYVSRGKAGSEKRWKSDIVENQGVAGKVDSSAIAQPCAVDSSAIAQPCAVDSSAIAGECLSHSNIRERKVRERKVREDIPPPPSADASVEDEFQIWYSRYPRCAGRGQAIRAYRAARKKTDADTLLAAVERFRGQVAGKDKEFVCFPATWLNGERWLDDTASAANDHIEHGGHNGARHSDDGKKTSSASGFAKALQRRLAERAESEDGSLF